MKVQRRIATKKDLATKLELFRRDNMKRHNMTTARNKMKEEIMNATRVRQAQVDHDRLYSSQVHGTGLDSARAAKLNELSKFISQYKR